MQCPSCNAELKAGDVCERCRPEAKGHLATRTSDAKANKIAATIGYSLGGGGKASSNDGVVKEPAESNHEISVGTTILGMQDGAAAAAATAQKVDETTISLSDAMIGEVLGSYRLLAVLGEGGMGRVYLAEHTKIGRRVALKMLHTHLARSPDVVRRFFDEARAVNRILHEHIVEITDFIENENGNNYFIMEHLRGAPLADAMGEDGAESFPLARSLGIGVQVASALSAVHTANIVHRDLKPENIFLTKRGGQKDFVKLLDFGIAKLIGDHGEGMRLQKTQAGMIMGTPDYMSPEQASGMATDHRTDIYSLGIILYELCTGKLPFIADNFGDLLVLHKTKRPVPPGRVPNLLQPIPAPLDELILQCLEKNPEDRPQSAKEVEERLHEIAWGFAVELEQFDLSAVVKKRGLASGVVIGIGGAVLLVAAAALIFIMTRSEGPSTGIAAAGVSEPDASSASAAQPVPAVSDPPTAQVALSFLSEPPGAMVYPAGEGGELLGVTPFTVSFDKTDELLEFEFRKVGFEKTVKQIAPDQRGSLNVVLTATEAPTTENTVVKKAVKKRTAKKRTAKKTTAKKKTVNEKRFKEGAVMNPFAE